MINIAAIIDFKSDKLSPRANQICNLINFIEQNFREVNLIQLYTFDEVKEVEVSLPSNVSLIQLTGFSDSGLLSIEQLNFIINSLRENNCNCIIGFKSILIDQILTSTAVKLDLPVISQVVSITKEGDNFTVKQSIFSGKANSYIKVSPASVFILNPSFEVNIDNSNPITIKPTQLGLPGIKSLNISGISKTNQGLSLTDANLVVGAGRGLKDPGNWTMIESLATKIGAATACSKPVSDINWRPHSEHVGQTGIKIAPQLYIACGISGAIQHLAGVNGSKTIIVINNDPEAPFFKYADYGIVGDVFDVLPEIVKNL
jgi:electron transfer flavoprotein alpha subunit